VLAFWRFSMVHEGKGQPASLHKYKWGESPCQTLKPKTLKYTGLTAAMAISQVGFTANC
jgi:hypothetical protein